MRRRRFHLFNLAWVTTMVTGLMLSGAGPATADPGVWDPTLPAAVSAGAPGDPLAVANASLQATAQATQTTLDLGRQFLGGLGINLGGNDAPAAATTNPGGKIPRVYGRQAIEYVIKRAGSQMGVPYSWGGGALDGPGKGVGDGPPADVERQEDRIDGRREAQPQHARYRVGDEERVGARLAPK